RDRRLRLPLGHAARRDRARRLADHRGADRSAVRDPRRPPRLPRRPDLAARRHLPRAERRRMSELAAPAVAAPPAHVQRWSPLSAAFTTGAALLVAALAFVPTTLGANATQKLTSVLILVILASMWNALAGYGGLVSIGQQAFIGIGA